MSDAENIKSAVAALLRATNTLEDVIGQANPYTFTVEEWQSIAGDLDTSTVAMDSVRKRIWEYLGAVKGH